MYPQMTYTRTTGCSSIHVHVYTVEYMYMSRGRMVSSGLNVLDSPHLRTHAHDTK